jgi:hypothetical protein
MQSPETIAAFCKLRTLVGLIIYVAKTIPCECLDEQKEAHKTGPKTESVAFVTTRAPN